MKIKRNKKGRGVYATKRYLPGDLIEVCPIILIPEKQVKKGDLICEYIFAWEKFYAFAFGYGSLYNHSYEPNAVYSRRKIKHEIVYKAHKKIQPNDEITVNYSGTVNGNKKMRFKIVD